MKILKWFRDRWALIKAWVHWYFSDELWNFRDGRKAEHLPTILELRHENLQLKAKNAKLMEINEALIDSGFGGKSDDVDLERLKSQFGMFFARSRPDGMPMEEFYFLRKTFMDCLSCSYQLGAKNGDRATRS